MDLQEFKNYCSGKKGVRECFPFDEETLVYKVGSKMFALTDINSETLWVNLKCDPDMAVSLRNTYPAIKPGYHMNKQYWNTLYLDGSIPDDKIYWLIDVSYNLVYKSLKKQEREQIMNS